MQRYQLIQVSCPDKMNANMLMCSTPLWSIPSQREEVAVCLPVAGPKQAGCVAVNAARPGTHMQSSQTHVRVDKRGMQMGQHTLPGLTPRPTLALHPHSAVVNSAAEGPVPTRSCCEMVEID